ncbi:MAG: YhjD/YihY/BrkB family envelope integrity protein [Byssovorax sp.]
MHPARSPAQVHPATNAAEDGFLASPRAWMRCLLTRLDANRTLGLGAEMAFWLFLSLLPLAAVVGVVAAKLAVGNWSIAAPLLDSLPGATRELLRAELGRMAAWNGGKVGLGAGVMFLWLASSGVHSIFDGIEIEANATPRPWWRKRVAALLTCLVLSAGTALLTLLATGLGWTWHILGGTTLFQALRFETSGVGQFLRFGLGALVSLGLVSGLYWIALPPATRRTMPIVPGALLATALQIAIGFGYGLYIKRVGDGGAYQAGLASIGVTLMALYLFCLVMLVGVEVNQMLGEYRRAQHLAAAV